MDPPPPRALVVFECSGRTREALRDLGVDAWSVDLKPSEDRSPHHYQMDAVRCLQANGPFEIVMAFPPCTELSVVGNKSVKHARGRSGMTAHSRMHTTLRVDAIRLFAKIMNDTGVLVGMCENPVGRACSLLRQSPAESPQQHPHTPPVHANYVVVQPYEFAAVAPSERDPEDLHCKRTALFSFGDQCAASAIPVERNHTKPPPGTVRDWVIKTCSQVDRSRTPPGMAKALASTLYKRHRVARSYRDVPGRVRFTVDLSRVNVAPKVCGTAGCNKPDTHLGLCSSMDEPTRRGERRQPVGNAAVVAAAAQAPHPIAAAEVPRQQRRPPRQPTRPAAAAVAAAVPRARPPKKLHRAPRTNSPRLFDELLAQMEATVQNMQHSNKLLAMRMGLT